MFIYSFKVETQIGWFGVRQTEMDIFQPKIILLITLLNEFKFHIHRLIPIWIKNIFKEFYLKWNSNFFRFFLGNFFRYWYHP